MIIDIWMVFFVPFKNSSSYEDVTRRAYMAYINTYDHWSAMVFKVIDEDPLQSELLLVERLVVEHYSIFDWHKYLDALFEIPPPENKPETKKKKIKKN